MEGKVGSACGCGPRIPHQDFKATPDYAPCREQCTLTELLFCLLQEALESSLENSWVAARCLPAFLVLVTPQGAEAGAGVCLSLWQQL